MQEQLLMMADTFYVTRDGREAYVAGSNRIGGDAYRFPWVGWVQGNDTPFTWSHDGAFSHEPNPLDLIRVRKESSIHDAA